MTDQELILKRARSAVLLRDFALASRLYGALLKNAPDDGSLLAEAGDLYVKSGRNDKALPYYLKIVEKNPEDFRALTSLGGIYRRLKKYDDSVSVLQKALETGADDAQVYYNLGFTYKFMGKYEDAIECFKTVIQENPNDVLAFNHLGTIYALRKDYEKAIDSYARGLKIDPNHPVLRLNLAKAYEYIHAFDKAESAYRAALRVRPGWQEAVEEYAKLLLKTRQTKKAETIVAQAVSLDARNPGMHYLLGNCFMAQSNYKNALHEYTTAAGIEPENPAVLSGLASVYEKLDMKEKAVEVLESLEKLRPDDQNIVRQYSAALLTASHFDAAYKQIRGIVEKSPEDPAALNLLGQYYLCRENDKKAEEIYTEIRKLDPSYVDYYRDAAERCYQLGNIRKAEKYIQEFLRKRPEDSAGLLALAVLYEAENNISDALDLYHKVLKYDRYNAIALDAVKRLGDLMTIDATAVPSVSEDVNADFEGAIPEISMEVDDKFFENTEKPETHIPDIESVEKTGPEKEDTAELAEDDELDLLKEDSLSFDALVPSDGPVDITPVLEQEPDSFVSGTTAQNTIPAGQDSVHEESENGLQKTGLSDPVTLQRLADVQEKAEREALKAVRAADKAEKAAEQAADAVRDIEDKSDDIAEKAARQAKKQAGDFLRHAGEMLDNTLKERKSSAVDQEDISETKKEPLDELPLAAEPLPSDQEPQAEDTGRQKGVNRNSFDAFEGMSGLLPSVVNMLVNSDLHDAYPELLGLFEKLQVLSGYLPPEKKTEFMSSKDRVQLDYVVAKLKGKPGLFSTAQALRKALFISDVNRQEMASLDLTGMDLVSAGLDLLTDLTSGLHDETLITALDTLAGNVRRSLAAAT